MDIYILRDGQEMGPFNEETTQNMLKQGSVVINDLAWQPGMPQWLPLHSVLYPAPTPAPLRPPAPPPSRTDEGVGAPVAQAEPVTAKQKAFLSYMGIPLPPELTKDQAALLINDALESPTDPARLLRWNEDRLRLHPELFRAEIQAKKEGRATAFYEAAQAQGNDVFDGVTKAHCQVLVGFLDVHHPNWDAAGDQHATWDYFFPAIAEKFPQLVKKEWRGKLKYREGPKVAPELALRSGVAKRPQAAFPLAAVIRAVVVGIGILLVLYAGYVAATKKPQQPAKGSIATRAKASQQTASEGTASSKSGATSLDLEKLFAEVPPIPAPGSSVPANGGPAGSSAASTADPAMANAPTGQPPGDPRAAATTTPAPLFDPLGPTVPAVTPSVSSEPGAGPPRTTVVITKATEVQLRFGRARLPPGTVVKFVGQEGGFVRIRYGNDIVAVPVASTDLLEASAISPQARPAAAPTVPIVPAPPATPPPTAPTSLF